MRFSSSRRYQYLSAAALLAGIVGYSATDAYQFWLMLSTADAAQSSISESEQERSSGKVNNTDPELTTDLLLSAPLFQLYDESRQPEPAEKIIPKTRVKLNLEAVYIASSQERNAAQISSPEGSQLYRLGDTVGEQRIIKAINENSVTLEVGGSLETLAFSEDTPDFFTRVVASADITERGDPVDAVQPAGDHADIAAKLAALKQRFGKN
ncbi:type II secretion system protein N [Endozoicomonas ascidiicola]|uniref:type II secretion system protein N n=1 Tax=Endozoicomonas ascidiicola TaxID=1698521 RepID=UPI000831237C|nr:type II secretion system protein N [Endozoicomonas ascidiicola]